MPSNLTESVVEDAALARQKRGQVWTIAQGTGEVLTPRVRTLCESLDLAQATRYGRGWR